LCSLQSKGQSGTDFFSLVDYAGHTIDGDRRTDWNWPLFTATTSNLVGGGYDALPFSLQSNEKGDTFLTPLIFDAFRVSITVH